MKLRLLVLIFSCSSFFNALLAEPPSYVETKNGVIAFTDPVFTGTSSVAKPELVSDDIIRAIAAGNPKARQDSK